MSDKCVHTEHCCSKHGCKYGSKECPVESGEKKQSYPCEYCEYDNECDNEVIRLQAEVERLTLGIRMHMATHIVEHDGASGWGDVEERDKELWYLINEESDNE